MSFADKATAFKHSVSGSSVNKSVCKASSHELAGPKKKHVDTLISLTNNPNSSMPMMADMLSERFHNTSWIVVMKALVTAHNLMTLGNEKFIQCMATRVAPFPLEDYVDRSSSNATQMSSYVRKYGRYLTSVCTGYRTLVLDIYRMPRGERSPFRTMEATKLLKSTATLQQQLDFLLEVDVNAGELTNGVINTAFLMLYKDLTKLYSCYNDVMINLLEKFFEMKKSQCREVIDAYRKFLTRQEVVVKFLTLAENVGVDKNSHLNLRQVPEDLLPALESHLKEMDAIRKAAAHQQPSPQIRAASEKLAQLSAKNPPPDKPSTPTPGSNGMSSSESIPSANEDLLAAQRKRFEELKRRASEKNVAVDGAESSLVSTTTTSAAPPKQAVNLDDEFDKIIEQRHTPTMTAKTATSGASSSGDLFGLNNWSSPPSLTATSTAAATSSNPWGSSTAPASNPFQSSYQEVNLFGTGTIQPTTPAQPGGGNLMGDILLPQNINPLATTSASQVSSKPLTTDVNSSLAAAAQNLSLDFGPSKTGTTLKTSHQWGETKPTVMTGGPAYVRPVGQLQPKTLPAAAPTFPVNPSVPMYGAPQPNPYGGGMGMGMGMGMQQPQMMAQPQMMSGGWPQQQPSSMMYPGSQNPFGAMPTTNTQSLF